MGFVPKGELPLPWGEPANGYLSRGVAIANRGQGYVRARPGDSTRYATPTLAALLVETGAQLHAAHPGSLPLVIGDAAGPNGGKHPRHRSHRTGRDVDLGFFVTTPEGKPIRTTARFDELGVGHSGGKVVLFDVAKNWALVKAMLASRAAIVQWIFCSEGVKALLLAHAHAVETDPDLLRRAALVLHQPKNAASHDDHFHVRVYCTEDERSRGCIDGAPAWPWVIPIDEKWWTTRDDTDDELLRAMTGTELEIRK